MRSTTGRNRKEQGQVREDLGSQAEEPNMSLAVSKGKSSQAWQGQDHPVSLN